MKARGFKMAFLGLVALAGFSFAVMLLWNALVPSIFGLAAINIWQALGLFALARILFGNFFAGAHRAFHGRNPIREKWMKMTPEERKEFVAKRKEYMRGRRFGHGHFFDERGFDFEANDSAKKEDE